jgi:hypothetical protein
MRMKLVIIGAGLAAALLATTAQALTVDEPVTAAYVREHAKEVAVKVTRSDAGLLTFTIVRTLPEPKYLVASLTVHHQGKITAESHAPSFGKKGENTFYFSLLPEDLAGSTFELGESFTTSGDNPFPLPGTINYQFRLSDFVPKE